MEIGICLTGHRPQGLYGYNNYLLYKKLEDFLYNLIKKEIDKFDLFYLSSGLALGADTCWTKAILRLRKEYPDKIKFYAHIPNFNQARKWINKEDVRFWDYSIKQADKLFVIDEDMKYSHGVALNLRNQSMVDNSNLIIGIYNGIEKGGTFNCLEYAKKKAFKKANISFLWNTIPISIKGDNKEVTSLEVKNVKENKEFSIQTDGVFIYVGMDPNNFFISKELNILADNGFVITNELMETMVGGLYAIGDIRDKKLRQITTAVGDGAIAAQEAYNFIKMK